MIAEHRSNGKMVKVRHDISSYFSETTVHGFRYVVEGRNSFEKLFWVIVIVIGFILSGFIIFQSFSDWEDTPLQTTIDQVSLPIEKLNVPAITICNPDALKMPQRNRWMYVEKLFNWINLDQGKIYHLALERLILVLLSH